MDLWSVAATMVGTALIVLVLVDVFMTVLFPASGHGPLREPLSRAAWHALSRVARRLSGERRRRFLTYSGPLLISQTILLWVTLLVFGWALVYLPALGTGVVAAQGSTREGFWTAVYVSGFSLTTLGTGDLVPVTDAYRILTVAEAGLGFSVFTMVLTYFLSIYRAITTRRTFASELEHRTLATGSAARLLAGLAREDGDLQEATAQLSYIAGRLTSLTETHRAYPVLSYFHYFQHRYALPRMLLIGLEAVSLLSSAVARDRYAGLLASSSLFQVRAAAAELLDELVPAGGATDPAPPLVAHWRHRFERSVEVLREAGVAVRPDIDAGAESYVADRAHWDGRLRGLAAAGCYEWDAIEVRDP